MLLDWGVHLIDQALFAFPGDPVVSVFARFDHITNAEVDDGCRINLIFESGMQYYVEVGTSNFIQLPRFYIQGTNGSALIPDWGNPIKVVCCKNWDEKDVVPIKAASGITKTMAPRDDKTIASFERPLPPFRLARLLPERGQGYRRHRAAAHHPRPAPPRHEDHGGVVRIRPYRRGRPRQDLTSR